MFDPLFDVARFINEWLFWTALTIGVLTFVGFFFSTTWMFIDDSFDKGVGLGNAIGVTISMTLGAFLGSLGLLFIFSWVVSYGWFPLLIISAVIGMAYIARGVRRLQKDFKKHVDNKQIHKGGRENV